MENDTSCSCKFKKNKKSFKNVLTFQKLNDIINM